MLYMYINIRANLHEYLALKEVFQYSITVCYSKWWLYSTISLLYSGYLLKPNRWQDNN